MKKNQRHRRRLSLALCLLTLMGVFPLSGITYAADTGCSHQHDQACGYIESAEGAPCTFTHEHDDACGYAEATDDAPCPVEAAHVHDDACGYADAVKSQSCTHTHDDNCGGLAQDNSPASCTLTEECNLPEGHEGECGLPITLGVSQSKSGTIAGDGYRFYPDTGELYVITAAGTTAWRTDADIDVDEVTRYKAVKSVGFQVNATAIGPGAFQYCTELTSAVLPGSVTDIEEFAFAESGLASIALPYQLQTIGKSSFFSSHLTEITLPASVTAIGESSFDSCQGLAAITFLGSTPPNIGTDAFKDIAAAGIIYYPAGANGYTEEWKNNAGLTGWTLQEQGAPVATTLSVEFNDNGSGGTKSDNEMKNVIEAELSAPGVDKTKIDTIKIAGNATEITEWNWRYLRELYHINSDWTNLYRLDLSELTGLKSLSNTTGQTYGNITKLTTLILPESLESIGTSAFNGCTKLTLTTLPDSVNTIGEGAFSMCQSLTLAKLPNEVTSIGNYAFSGCTGLTAVELPGRLQIIGSSAFYSCKNLTSLIFPKTVQRIETSAFAYCSNLTGMTFLGKTAPGLGSNVFNKIPSSGTLFLPANAAAYDSGTFGTPALDGWIRQMSDILEVPFNSNESGGNSLTDNNMKTAVETALDSGDKTKVTTIRSSEAPRRLPAITGSIC